MRGGGGLSYADRGEIEVNPVSRKKYDAISPHMARSLFGPPLCMAHSRIRGLPVFHDSPMQISFKVKGLIT